MYRKLSYDAATAFAPIINNEDIGRMLETPQMKEWLMSSLGGEIAPNTPEQFGVFLATDSARWQAIIKQIGLQLD